MSARIARWVDRYLPPWVCVAAALLIVAAANVNAWLRLFPIPTMYLVSMAGVVPFLAAGIYHWERHEGGGQAG